MLTRSLYGPRPFRLFATDPVGTADSCLDLCQSRQRQSTVRLGKDNERSENLKRTTSSTPVNFQRRLRLLEAQRLMAEEWPTAESAGYRVGYQSPSHFSREYARMFGSPLIAHRNQLKKDEKEAKPLGALQAHWF